MGCPNVEYGISSGGATEYSASSGRELFQCGTNCVKLYIVNISVETVQVNITCESITDAGAGDVCMRSGSMSLQNQGVVNWIAKNGVTTGVPSGNAINMAGSCAGGDAFTYTHTDGQASGRVTANIGNIVSNEGTILSRIRDHCGCAEDTTASALFFLSDASTDVGPTEWQGGSITFQGFGEGGGGTNTGRANFNWQNGIKECRQGSVEYDSTGAPAPAGTIIKGMMG